MNRVVTVTLPGKQVVIPVQVWVQDAAVYCAPSSYCAPCNLFCPDPPLYGRAGFTRFIFSRLKFTGKAQAILCLCNGVSAFVCHCACPWQLARNEEPQFVTQQTSLSSWKPSHVCMQPFHRLGLHVNCLPVRLFSHVNIGVHTAMVFCVVGMVLMPIAWQRNCP